MKNLDWSAEFSPKREYKLDTMRNVLRVLGNPDKKLKNVIHIAGTNGKGSTANYIKTILEKSGHKVGIFTSPHLIEFNERIHFCGRNITDDEIERYKHKIISTYNKPEEITYFELTTLIAIMIFADNNLDYCIFEVGLGGTLDCTNVFEKPLVSVITSISYDHMAVLGNTLTEIAKQKAGIIKQNVPVFTSNTNKEIIDVLQQTAQEKNAKLYQLGKDFNIDNTLKPSLFGDYQFENASLAKAVCKYIGIEEKYINEGIANTIWLGRLQQITLKNINNQQFNIVKTYLDGAHNEDGIKKLCEFILQVKNENQNCNITGVFACLKRKKYQSFFPFFEKVGFEKLLFFNNITDEKNDFVETNDLIEEAEKYSINADKIEDIVEIKNHLDNKKQNIIFLFGSLHFVGCILENEV